MVDYDILSVKLKIDLPIQHNNFLSSRKNKYHLVMYNRLEFHT